MEAALAKGLFLFDGKDKEQFGRWKDVMEAYITFLKMHDVFSDDAAKYGATTADHRENVWALLTMHTTGLARTVLNTKMTSGDRARDGWTALLSSFFYTSAEEQVVILHQLRELRWDGVEPIDHFLHKVNEIIETHDRVAVGGSKMAKPVYTSFVVATLADDPRLAHLSTTATDQNLHDVPALLQYLAKHVKRILATSPAAPAAPTGAAAAEPALVASFSAHRGRGGHGRRGRGAPRGRGAGIQCYRCQGFGHISRDCATPDASSSSSPSSSNKPADGYSLAIIEKEEEKKKKKKTSDSSVLQCAIVDSAATRHLLHPRSVPPAAVLQPSSARITTANGDKMAVKGEAHLTAAVQTKGGVVHLPLQNVAVSDAARFSLVSLPALMESLPPGSAYIQNKSTAQINISTGEQIDLEKSGKLFVLPPATVLADTV
jgi:hypothetical protein